MGIGLVCIFISFLGFVILKEPERDQFAVITLNQPRTTSKKSEVITEGDESIVGFYEQEKDGSQSFKRLDTIEEKNSNDESSYFGTSRQQSTDMGRVGAESPLNTNKDMNSEVFTLGNSSKNLVNQQTITSNKNSVP